MSTHKKTIVVVGATGAQGASVVNAFLSSPSWHIRALTRSASSDKAQALNSKGVEVVAADANEPSTLTAAFQGAHAVFAVTDFWTLFGQATFNPSVLRPGQPAVEYAFEKELQQGKNFFDAAAKISTLERFVFSSLTQPSKWSNGKYTYALHLESKGQAVEYGRTTYPDLWSKTSIIQLGFYLENVQRTDRLAPTKMSDGIFTFTDPTGHGYTFPMVSADADTGAITKSLIENVPAGKNVAAYREWMSIADYATQWSKTLGVKAQTVVGDMLKTPPGPALKRETDESWAFMREFGFFGGDPSIVLPHEIDAGLKLGSVEEWVKAQDWSSTLAK